MYSESVKDENYLRGVQVADDGGKVRFTSIFPGCYAEDGYEQSVDNLAEVSLQSDMVFGDDAGVHQLATVTGDVATGYTVTLGVGVK